MKTETKSNLTAWQLQAMKIYLEEMKSLLKPETYIEVLNAINKHLNYWNNHHENKSA